MRAQISVELLTTLGIVLAFTIPIVLLIFALTQYGYENTSMIKADAAARILAESINDVYAQGDGAKRTLLINLPTNTEYIMVGENEVVINIKLASGNYEAALPFFGNASRYSRQSIGGLVLFTVENVNGEVRVS